MQVVMVQSLYFMKNPIDVFHSFDMLFCGAVLIVNENTSLIYI